MKAIARFRFLHNGTISSVINTLTRAKEGHRTYPVLTGILLLGTTALGFTGTASASTLQDRGFDVTSGYHMIYDADRNLTWLDVNPGYMIFGTAQQWVAGLNVAGKRDWRFPIITDIGGDGCNFGYSGTDCGYNVLTKGSELAHLFYDELGNKAQYDTSGKPVESGWGLTNTGLFTNLESWNYWSGTIYEPNGIPYPDTWYFSTYGGAQHAEDWSDPLLVLAVRFGDVAPVPVPAAVWLLGSGLLGLLSLAQRRGHPPARLLAAPLASRPIRNRVGRLIGRPGSNLPPSGDPPAAG